MVGFAGVCAGGLQRRRESRRGLAGGGAVSRVDEFVESIPFTETREYVQAILRNQDIYQGIDQYARSVPATQRAEAKAAPRGGIDEASGSTIDRAVTPVVGRGKIFCAGKGIRSDTCDFDLLLGLTNYACRETLASSNV